MIKLALPELSKEEKIISPPWHLEELKLAETKLRDGTAVFKNWETVKSRFNQ